MTTQTDRTEQMHALVKALVEQTAELRTTEGWQRWLKFASSFRHYSLSNQMLILSQRPDATQVAGFRHWRKLGRHVRKGERGIAIYAPTSRRVRPEDDRDESVRRIVTGFRLVHVFDVAQTEGAALPTWELPAVQVDHETLLCRVAEAATAQGQAIRLADRDAAGEARGWFEPATGLIYLVRGYPAAGQLRTLLHELAHASDVGRALRTRAESELLAEAAAYVVGVGRLGMGMEDASATYVSSWARSLNDLAKLAGDVVSVARVVERLVEAALPTSSDTNRPHERTSDICTLMQFEPERLD